MATPGVETAKNPLREIVQPFIDVVRAPRALWGVNISYLLEGFVYFGVVGYLAMYFNQYVGLDDVWAGRMTGALTWGITLAMFMFGGLADRWGVRIALVAALALMLVGRVFLAGGPTMGLAPGGMFSPAHWVALFGILLVVLGYGMYQPAAYAAVRQFTTPATAGMGYAMLYALMNLGGWLPSFFAPIRRAVGISGAIWVYAGFTVLGLVLTSVILSKRTVDRAIASARAASGKTEPEKPKDAAPKEPFSVMRWLKNHPMADPKFSFFIFCLIPVQTLFAHNWLTLPMYVERAYRGTWTGNHFEVAVNFNPLLIFILVPIVAALTQKAKVYNMMILGTAVMAAPTFLLAIGPSTWTLFGYLVLMTVGEAMWQPRFLQYAAEIAPEGRTGAYMGVAQFPWFLTKMITSLYSGWFLLRYCPPTGPQNTERMWLIYGFIAVSSTVMLILARNWLGKDFKTKSD
jgi:POT family proton-dependent oligopeptide transporter